MPPRTMSGHYVLKAAQLSEFAMFARWTASRFKLTAIQIRAIETDIQGMGDTELAQEFGVTRQAVHYARKAGLRRLRAGLRELGIDGVSAVL